MIYNKKNEINYNIRAMWIKYAEYVNRVRGIHIFQLKNLLINPRIFKNKKFQ